MHATDLLRFGRFELQPRERRLLKDGVPAPLGARAFDVLLVLAGRAGELVHKSELLDAVWAGLVVEEANLAVQVSALRKVLGDGVIATIPGRGYRFTAPLQAAPHAAKPLTLAEPAAADGAAPPAPPVTFGPAALLIGREDDLTALTQTLQAARCVTLVGPAGVGKTALARALAAQAPAGAVWVDLAPLGDGAQLPQALARAMGMALPASDAAAHLAARVGARLLVLDNAEHLVAAVAACVDALLQAGSALRVLATSQLRLAVAGEQVHRLEPLALPLDSDTLDLHRGAMALFVQKARAADHRFQPSPAQLPLLRSICRRLDGLPLALEMAAARVPALGLQGLAQALEARFNVLTAGRRDAAARHRTLQAALDWSHGLLSPEEQRVYRRCGVFSGSFSLDLLVAAATEQPAVAEPTDRWALIDTLANLVDRSLVAVDDADPPRYRLLDTMRDDARSRLAASGEVPQLQARRLAALVRQAQGMNDGERISAQRRDALLGEHDDLRDALAWGQAQTDAAPRADTVRLACDVAAAATFSSWRLEAMRWLEACEPLAESPDMPATVRARWWYERTRQRLMSRHQGARQMAEHTLTLYAGLDDDAGTFNALSNLARAPGGEPADLQRVRDAMRAVLARHPEWGAARAYTLAGVEANVCDQLGDHEGSLRHRLREADLARQMGNAASATAAETNVVFLLQTLGRHAEALERARALDQRLQGSQDGNTAYALVGLVTSLCALGHFAELRALLPRAWHVLRLHGLPLADPHCVLMLAAEGRLDDALRVLGRATARHVAAGIQMTPDENAALQALRDDACGRLGADQAERAIAEGAAMADDAIDALVLSPAPAGAVALSPR
jgi:non-specific serine/threonine protein kinase